MTTYKWIVFAGIIVATLPGCAAAEPMFPDAQMVVEYEGSIAADALQQRARDWFLGGPPDGHAFVNWQFVDRTEYGDVYLIKLRVHNEVDVFAVLFRGDKQILFDDGEAKIYLRRR